MVIAKVLSIASLLFASALAGQPAQHPAGGRIYGAVVDHAGQPARGVTLCAMPLGIALGTALRTTKTDAQGKFRFENLSWLGRYTILGSDPEAGYSEFALWPSDSGPVQEVILSPQHPEAEFNFRLPPPAGFLHIHLTNSRTGEAIPGMVVSVYPADRPDQSIFSGTSGSDRTILVAPDRNLLLHIKSQGFKEWNESVGKGKPIRVASGAQVTVDVKLEPSH